VTIPEIDEFVNWVIRNVLDMPESDDDMSFGYRDAGSYAGRDAMVDQTELRPTRAELINVPTEHDFPLSLLEYILGLDRI